MLMPTEFSNCVMIYLNWKSFDEQWQVLYRILFAFYMHSLPSVICHLPRASLQCIIISASYLKRHYESITSRSMLLISFFRMARSWPFFEWSTVDWTSLHTVQGAVYACTELVQTDFTWNRYGAFANSTGIWKRFIFCIAYLLLTLWSWSYIDAITFIPCHSCHNIRTSEHSCHATALQFTEIIHCRLWPEVESSTWWSFTAYFDH